VNELGAFGNSDPSPGLGYGNAPFLLAPDRRAYSIEIQAKMRTKTPTGIFAFTCLVSWLAAAASLSQQQPFPPTVGQAGKDVIWVPTSPELVAAMLEMAKVDKNDLLMDLGSGDGRIVIAAAKLGATAIGFEYEQAMVELSRSKAQEEGVAGKATFLQGDIFQADFSKATVITMYLLPDLNLRLRPKILEMKPGTRVVSHAFTMEKWQWDQMTIVEGSNAYLWIVPAKVEGTWTWQGQAGAVELRLRQTFQKIEGTLSSGGRDLPIKKAKLEGTHIIFTVGEYRASTREYSGTVTGNSIAGIMKNAGGPETKWMAERRAAK
jgi:precorrin-6B methylase 2